MVDIEGIVENLQDDFRGLPRSQIEKIVQETAEKFEEKEKPRRNRRKLTEKRKEEFKQFMKDPDHKRALMNLISDVLEKRV